MTLLRRVAAVSSAHKNFKNHSTALGSLPSPNVQTSQPPVKLVDSFSRPHTYLRISITERCNLRCQYCMPLDGVELTSKPQLLTTTEIIKLAALFAEMGVNKIRLTGGEPLVNKDCVFLVESLKNIKGIESVALTTNGLTLARHLPDLVSAGLDNVNISLDTLVPQKFAFVSRRPASGLKKVLNGIEAALASPLKSVKVNTVVMKNVNEDEICDFVQLTQSDPLSVRFLEFMPFSGNSWSDKKFIPYTAQIESIEEKYGSLKRLNDEKSSTSMNYSVKDHVGNIGFISSMSRNFCGGCNRLRLTHDGMLKVCLFGRDEVSLRDLIRDTSAQEGTSQQSNTLVRDVVSAAVLRKKFSHGGLEGIQSELHRPMILIGNDVAFLAKTRKVGQIISRGLCSDIHVTHPLGYVTETRVREAKSRDLNPSLSHLDKDGQAHMVDVGGKPDSIRTAVATSRVQLNDVAYKSVVENSTSKGAVLTVAKIAGIQGAKLTSTLIPLCHQISLNKVDITFEFLPPKQSSITEIPPTNSNKPIQHLEQTIQPSSVLHDERYSVKITCTVSCSGKTGVEMEALVGASTAALTVYDMCKSVDKGAVIASTKLVSKSGGKSGDFTAA